MTRAVALVVVVGIAASVVSGLGVGFDGLALLLLALIAALGGLGLAVARRARSGAVTPLPCPECGGLLSAHAPYCKHCGAPLPQSGRGTQSREA
jgi:hypothetical protein